MPLSGKNKKNHYSQSEYETWRRHYEDENYGQGVFPFPLTLLAECVIFVFQALKKPGFFHDEIESPERVTISVIRLSGSLLTSRIIADSVKNSIEFLSQKWGF